MSIDRPKVAQLDALLATVAKIRKAEARLTELKEQAAREARALAEITDKKLRIGAGFYAYWLAPEVSATDIALGATGRSHPARLMKLAGAVSIGVPCERCQVDLPIRSRSQMKEVLHIAHGADPLPETYRILCVPCQNALNEESLQERMAEIDAYHVRQLELQAMSYAEYLDTEEFDEARALHLWWHADRYQALECEACDDGTTLGIYHKPPENGARLGGLIMLCAVCRDALLAAGKLGQAPLEPNLIPEELAARALEAARAERSY
jgi:hypothetical protein